MILHLIRLLILTAMLALIGTAVDTAGAGGGTPEQRYCWRAGRHVPPDSVDRTARQDRAAYRLKGMGCHEYYGVWIPGADYPGEAFWDSERCERASLKAALRGGYRAAVRAAERIGCTRAEDGSWYGRDTP